MSVKPAAPGWQALTKKRAVVEQQIAVRAALQL
jgi:hypothetical protein